MVLSAHKTVAMFMRYIHTDDAPVHQAADRVANRRKAVVGAQRPKGISAGAEGAASPDPHRLSYRRYDTWDWPSFIRKIYFSKRCNRCF